VIQFGSRKNEQLPAPKAGGLYNCRGGFVETSPSRSLRDGEGIYVIKWNDSPELSKLDIGGGGIL
jgi:hypothetical protein